MYEFDWTSIPGAIPLLLKGMLITLEVTLTAIVVGIVWGTLLAVARLGSNRVRRDECGFRGLIPVIPKITQKHAACLG